MSAAEPQTPTLPPVATLARFLAAVCRLRMAWMVEAELSGAASESPRFIRGYEGAPCDGALIVDEALARSLPKEATDKYFSFLQHTSKTEDVPPILLLDFKSFSYNAVFSTSKIQARNYNYHYAQAIIHVSLVQYNNCQAMVIGNIVDADYVALVPMEYVHMTQPKYREQWWLGHASPGQVQSNPLPAVLAPFVMTKQLLPLAFDNLVAHHRDSNIKLYNPFSGLNYSHASTSELAPLHMIRRPDYEEGVKHKVWKAFRGGFAKGESKYTVRNPHYAPITADLRLDHIDGQSILVEVKSGLATVKNLPQGRQELLHDTRWTKVGKMIFHMFVPWDYLLALVSEDEGYMICKDDIPDTFWHNEGNANGKVSHEFPDHSFLDSRRIRFDVSDAVLARGIQRVIQGDRDAPRSAMLQPEDIEKNAGPCSFEFLRGMIREEGAEVDLEETEEEQETAETADAEAEDLGAEDAGDTNQRKGQQFATESRSARIRLAKGVEFSQDSVVFDALQIECRRRGKGCMIDLGSHHPYGRMAMVDYTWPEKDKLQFDRTGTPPLWLGRLHSNIPMVTLLLQSVRWVAGYAPLEPTPAETHRQAKAPPSLLICTPLAREESDYMTQRWVVPSGFMPKVHVGQVKQPSVNHFAFPLLLNQQLDIENFLVAEHELYDTVYKFLSGSPTVTVGLGEIEVETKSYLRLTRDAKAIGEKDFKGCVQGRKMELVRALQERM